jgi:branched-chain amino acid aminotransferase
MRQPVGRLRPTHGKEGVPVPITQVEKIWMDGELVDWAEAKVHVLSHALHYGSGVFEGIRAYETSRGPAVWHLDEHLRRLFRSAKLYHMDLPYSHEALVEATKDLIRANGLSSCYIRPLAFRGYGEMGVNPLNAEINVTIAVWPWGAYLGEEALEQGVRIKISSWRRNSQNSLPAAAKASGQYINSVLAKVESLKAGYDEAIMLNEAGQITDGSGENVFVVRDGALTTPPIQAGCLDGVTRGSVIMLARDLGYEVREDNLVRTDLYNADECFFTGTAAEITPIREVDDRVVGEGHRGPVTKELQSAFFAATKGEDQAHSDWLTYVNA